MRWILTTTAVLMVAAVASADDPAKADLDALQGDWKIVSAEADGKPVPADQLPPKLTFKADKMIGLGKEMGIKLDPTKKPKHVDITAKRGEETIEVPTIYELKGDDLTLAIPLVEPKSGETGTRPENFDTKGKPLLVMKLKREKK